MTATELIRLLSLLPAGTIVETDPDDGGPRLEFTAKDGCEVSPYGEDFEDVLRLALKINNGPCPDGECDGEGISGTCWLCGHSCGVTQ